MNLNQDLSEHEYFPPYDKCDEVMETSEGFYTAYIRLLNYKSETEYPGIYSHHPRVHITLINSAPDTKWTLRADFISSAYVPRPLLVGEVVGLNGDKFYDSEVYDTLKKLLMTSWN